MILLFCQCNKLLDVGLKTIGEGDSTGKSQMCARVASEAYDYLLLQPDVDLRRSQKNLQKHLIGTFSLSVEMSDQSVS